MDELDVKYQKSDFLVGTEPFEEVYSYRDDVFEMDRQLELMADMAKLVGVKNFKALFKKYCQKMKAVQSGQIADNTTNFSDQELELATGSWVADDYGITGMDKFGFEITACVHPIMPIERLVNTDTNIVKIKLAYKLNGSWRTQIVDKRILASSTSIVQLADFDIAVTSENAKYLVQYLHDVQYLNYNQIPEKQSVSRLGWITEDLFSPYTQDLIFDGDASYKHMFEAVQQEGSYDKWLEVAKEVRSGDCIVPRIQLAASFASVLVGPLHGLPFFVHLWGGSETGKTVGLLLATSVWANPEMGKYCQTFNSTNVAQELSAGFVNSMPLMLDELQLEKDKKSFDKLIYQLSEGVGRSRGAKTGGLQKTPTWRNCIGTTGEQPLTSDISGGGAINRIIEINCENIKLFPDPGAVLRTIKLNYGYAGKDFIEKVLSGNNVIGDAKCIYDAFYKKMVSGATEKQAMAAALILTADTVADLLIFKDGKAMTVGDINKYLSSKADIDQNLKALDWLRGWIVQNQNKFITCNNADDLPHEIWGSQVGETTSIIKHVFNKACKEEGYNPSSFLSWLQNKCYIAVDSKGNPTRPVRLPEKVSRCVVFNDDGGSKDEFQEVLNGSKW